MSIFRDFGSSARRSGAPGTIGIVAGMVGMFVFFWLFHGKFADVLPLAHDLWGRPWSLLTYPFVTIMDGNSLIWLVVLAMWIGWTGGAVEREIGTPKFLALFFGLTLVGGLGIWLGTTLLGIGSGWLVYGSTIPVGAITVIWGVRNPSATVVLMFVLPIAGRWLAWLSAGIVLFKYGSDFRSPFMGLFACIPLGGAYLFAVNRIPGFSYSAGSTSRGDSQALKSTERRNDQYFDDVHRREKDREERERLRKLFEGPANDENGK